MPNWVLPDTVTPNPATRNENQRLVIKIYLTCKVNKNDIGIHYYLYDFCTVRLTIRFV